SRQPVVASCDAPEVFQPVEGTLDAPAQLVETLAEAERLFPVAAIGNDRLGSSLIQFLAQFCTIVSLVAEQPFRRLHSADQTQRPRPPQVAKGVLARGGADALEHKPGSHPLSGASGRMRAPR